MKKVFSFKRRSRLPLLGLVSLALFATACKKTFDTPAPQVPVSGLMAFNLVPDKTSVGITISGGNLINYPLPYTSFTGGYLGVYSGTQSVASYDGNTGTILSSGSQVFADSSNYSLFVVGQNNNYRNVIVKDNLTGLSASSGQAFVRYVNAIGDSTHQPLVTLSSGTTNVFNINAPFASVSDFKSFTPGSITVTVNDEAGINATRSISVEQGKIYTVLLTGIPGAEDSTRAVQIKFIQNGTASANP